MASAAHLDDIDFVDPDRYVREGYPHEDWTRLRRPPKNGPKNGSAWRTIDSAAMLTTAGDTFSTTSTIGVRRDDCAGTAGGAARASRSTKGTNAEFLIVPIG